MSSPGRGFTLIEVLIAGALSLLCLGFLAGMLFPSMALYGRQSRIAEAQQASAVVMDRLRVGILGSLPETVSTSSDGRALAWRPGDPSSPFRSAGGRNFLGQFDVYAWQADQGTLTYIPWAPTSFDFTTVGPLPAADFPSLPQPNTRIVARDVTLFRVTQPLRFPLEVELTVSPPTPKGKTEWTARASIMPPAAHYPD